MFTGIITDIGRLVDVSGEDDRHLRIQCRYDPAGIDLGASIACDGICLTVTDRGGVVNDAWFTAMASAETLSKTSLAGWQTGRAINLERALRLGDEMGGHLVAGHVDDTAVITDIYDDGDSTRFGFTAPPALARFIAPKGSVALNGTSLTVNDVAGLDFGINMIPHTMAVTNWQDRRVGDAVNLEIDLLARYVARLNDTMTTS